MGDSTDGTPLVRTTVRDSPTLAVVRAVAAVENREPQSLRPLGEVVDPEALNAVVGEGEGPVRVSFGYAGHRVVLHNGAVEVY